MPRLYLIKMQSAKQDNDDIFPRRENAEKMA